MLPIDTPTRIVQVAGDSAFPGSKVQVFSGETGGAHDTADRGLGVRSSSMTHPPPSLLLFPLTHASSE